MKLNKDQIAAEERLLQFFNDPHEKLICVIGPGGSGKTASVVEFVKNHQEHVKRTVLTAPTNTATGVLDKFSKDVGRFIPTQTIYKLLGLILGNDGEVKTTFRGNDGKFDLFDTIIIDEGSMAGITLCNDIEERMMGREKVKIIVMMDPCQLNPINERATRLLEMGPHIYLNEDMRSGNGPLLTVKRAIRDLVLERIKGDLPMPGGTTSGTDVNNLSRELKVVLETNLDEDGSGVHFLRGKEFDDAMLDMFDTPQYKADPNFVRALAWTNKEVERMNRMIRSRIFGKGCDPYVLGERVCVLTPIIIDDEVVFSIDEEAIISGIEVATWNDFTDQDSPDPSYTTYRVTLKRPGSDISYDIPVMHEDSMRKFQRRLDFISERCKMKERPWKSFWDFHDTFIKLRPAHALTVHKSQGQTFGCVFVNMKDIMRNTNVIERSRLGYVAMSRPTTDLVVNIKTFS